MATNENYRPEIHPTVRTAIYTLGLFVGTLSVLVTAGAAVWWPEHATEVLASVGAVATATSFLAGATGVVYRPHNE